MERPARAPVTVLIAVGISFLVVCSGCSALFPQHEYPPGVTESGVENATALADAQQEHLQQGFRVSSTTTYSAQNGTVLQRVESSERWTPEQANRSISFETPHAILGVNAQIYKNETSVTARVETGTGDIVLRNIGGFNERAVVPGPGVYWESSYSLVATGNTSVTAFENGTTRISFGSTNDADIQRHGRLYVDSSGLITRLVVTETRQAYGTTATVHWETTFSHIGNPAVVTPDWVANDTSSR